MASRFSSAIVKSVTTFHKHRVTDRRTDAIARAIATIAPLDSRVLDIGSGNGRLAERLTSYRQDLEIEGIDIKSAENPKLPIRVYDGHHIPYDDSSWDMCMLNDVLHHCTSPVEILREAKRVAREYILIKDHVADNLFDKTLLCLMDWAGNRGYDTPLPYNFLSSTDWLQLYAEFELEPQLTITNLELYSRPLTWLCDRRLHFLTLLRHTSQWRG